MAHVLIRHKVQDYRSWRPVFEANMQARKDASFRGATVLQAKDDPNNVFIMCEIGDVKKAKEFAETGFKKFMVESGVVEPPDVYYLEGEQYYPS